jgi:CRISPR system Cascade subunit CasE
MFLTRIKLDLRNRQTVLALKNPNIFHGALERASSNRNIRQLWRVDQVNGATYLLVLTYEEVNFDAIVRQFGFVKEGFERVCYDGLLSRIEVGSFWRFLLVANPTYRGHAEKDSRGILHAHNTVEFQKEWLAQKAASNGFSILENSVGVTTSELLSFKKGRDGKRLTFRRVTFEGVLRVEDVGLFRDALVNGIGRAKAYGMGLITVARL